MSRYAAGPTDRGPRRRADHPGAPQRAGAGGAHRGGQGQVDGRVRDGAAGLERGLRRRGVPVRQERQVESGRGGRFSRRWAGCTTSRASAGRSNGTRWAAGWSWSRKAGQRGRPRRRRPPTAGPRSPAGWRSSATTSTCSTSSPIRSSGAGSTSTRWSRCLPARPGTQHVVITGRDAPPQLIDAADLVTEMTKVKHPMDAGRKGQKGIEW